MNRLGILALMFLIVGCGTPGIPRQPVYGTIAGANGRSGLISFVPKPGTQGPSARVAIQDGSFEFDESNGPFPGLYRVTIRFERSPKLDQNQTVSGSVINVKGVNVPISEVDSMPMQYGAKHSQIVSVPKTGSLNLDLKLKPQSSSE
jgi:hypothetical protein